MMLEMMDFKGKEELMSRVRDMGTLQDAMMQVSQIALALASRYDPAIAQQLAPIIQGIGIDAGSLVPGQAGGGAPGLEESTQQAEAAAGGRPSDENALVRKARERTADASRL
jgi:hypothetical protein